VIEEQTVHLLDALRPIFALITPAVYVATLLGMINSCVFYLFLGRGLRLFLPYLAIGSAAAVLGMTVGRQLPESGPSIGDVSVVAASISAWTILFIARALHL
jgi:hypothetical protein